MDDVRHAIDGVLHAAGLRAQRVRRVAKVYCDVYRIRPQGGASDVALRVYPAARVDRTAIEAEIAWLAALADEGLHVPRPIADERGEFIQRWSPDPSRHAVLVTWLGGRMHDRGLTPERLRRVGVLTARLHRTSARLVREGAIATRRLAYESDLLAWAGGTRAGTQALDDSFRAAAMAAARGVAEELAVLPRTPDAWGFVHGDLHQWNLLFSGDAAGAIDFSDCGWGHAAMDLAGPLQFLRHWLVDQHDHRAQFPRLQEALLRGYSEVAPLPHGIERQVDLYIVARLFMSLDWILDDWPRPDHRPWRAKFLRGCEDAFRAWAARRSSLRR
jgi:Ser/Thr protein kinase RdoA (MazF antagonist)